MTSAPERYRCPVCKRKRKPPDLRYRPPCPKCDTSELPVPVRGGESAGRPRVAPEEGDLVLVSLRMPKSIRAGLTRLGDGNRSEGLRRLWKEHAEQAADAKSLRAEVRRLEKMNKVLLEAAE